MRTLSDYIVENAHEQRSSQVGSRRVRGPISEDVGDVRIVRSAGLDAAIVALPAGISLDGRADRMNDFWRALAEFQDRDVLVVAICADGER